MKIIVTGATGFVGQHLVARLLQFGHEIVGIARSANRFKQMPWHDHVRCISADVHADHFPWHSTGVPELLIHLAWPGLPNYENDFHFLENFPADYRFLCSAVAAGCPRLMVTGTGAEFGMSDGELLENTPTAPVSAYGIAKDSLRRSLFYLQRHQPFTLQWVRLFHMYGAGQHPHSLLAQLESAIAAKREFFDMSGGEQLRDYLPVQQVAEQLAILANHPELDGVLHGCSGKPISVKQLVENKIAETSPPIKLNLGVYPYPSYEPMAYWGNTGRLGVLLAHQTKSGKPALTKEAE